MSKILKAIKHQQKVEGLTEDLQQVKRIYQHLKETTGHIWESEWNTLVCTKFTGSYPYKRFYYTTNVGKLLKLI
jgi:hypothetical protein